MAVKIIEHHEGSPGTASSGGKRINVGRESLLATTMAHPNVVSTALKTQGLTAVPRIRAATAVLGRFAVSHIPALVWHLRVGHNH